MNVPRIESTQRDVLGWYGWTVGPKAHQQVVLQCPKGHRATISRGEHGHQIADDGTVTPSVVCPGVGCDFHEHVKLDGWEARAA